MTNKVLTDRDKLINASRNNVAHLCVTAFSALQGHFGNKEEQLLALAGSFILMADALKVEPQDAATAVRNLMVDPNHSDGLLSQFAAMKYHLETELCRDARSRF